jgi:hypothetical protein
MRKYVVPIVALVGIALLSPSTNAANLIIKSRLGVPGHNVSLPVAVTNVGGTGQLWGLDFGVTFDTTKLTVGTDATNGTAFTPQAVGTSTEVPVVVSGTTFVGTGVANPSLYVGIVRGTSAFTTTQNTAGGPTSSIGLLRLAVPTGVANGTVVALSVPTTYNVANDGTGSTTISRAGATGATSDATAGSAVASEAITVSTVYPVTANIVVPLNEVAVGAIPGDVIFAGSSLGKVDAADYSKTINAFLGKTTLNDYQKIAADVGPANGYVPGTNLGGTAGLSYGDGKIDAADYSLMVAKFLGKSTPNFPISE